MSTLHLRYKVFNPVEKSIIIVVTYVEIKFPNLTNKWYKDANLGFGVQSV
jgi:hypothetical protein